MNDDDPSSPCQNLILIGFMGCGKSTIGRELHSTLGYPHIDTDQHIEEIEGCSVPEIFERSGEAYFRERESDLLRDLLERQTQCHIISTGGGVPLREDNRVILRRLGFVVWLDASADAVFERVSRNSNRPLLQTENPRETVEELLKIRSPLYEATAHMRIKTDALNSSEIAYGVIESARVFFSNLNCA